MSGKSRLSEEEYEELLKPLAEELSAMARWVSETNQRVVILFEGRDTAGKGGSIEMFARLLNPRQCRTVALPSPSAREKTQWYFQRYIGHLPAAGEIILFDRSWYNRAGVERVMGFCTADQTQDFLNSAPEFERHLVDDGMLLFKYWLCCDQAVQEERFEHRLNNPTRRWKLSPIDIEAREHYDDYTEARELMLSATHTDFAPWTLIDLSYDSWRETGMAGAADAASRSARPRARHRAAAGRDRVAAARPQAVKGTLWSAPSDRRLSDREA